MKEMSRIRSLGLHGLANARMAKSAAGEFSLENILNRVFEEFGVERGEQARIIDAISNTMGRKTGKILPENAAFFENAAARAINRISNTRSDVLRPSLSKVRSILPIAATAVGVPVLATAGLGYLKKKLGNR